jgi:uracil-DNA glycosylase family 4
MALMAGIDRSGVYVTNAVKHFKFEERGKRRLHKKPRMSEIKACKPWLEAEMSLLKPEVIVCLGATAVQAILGTKVSSDQRARQVRRKSMGAACNGYNPSLSYFAGAGWGATSRGVSQVRRRSDTC